MTLSSIKQDTQQLQQRHTRVHALEIFRRRTYIRLLVQAFAVIARDETEVDDPTHCGDN